LSKASSGRQWRQWLLLLLLVGLTVLVTSRFTSLTNLLSTLAQGLWQWILIGIVIHIVYFVAYAAMYQSGFATVGVNTRTRDLLPVVFASIFVNAVAPSGGAGGAALFVDHAVRNGQSGARAAVGTVFVLLADLGTLFPFLVFGTLYLYHRRELQVYDIIGGVLFMVYVSILAAVLALARWIPGILHRIFHWVQGVVNRVGGWFRHPHLLGEAWADRNADQFLDGTEAIAANPWRLWRTLGWGMGIHLINLAGLYAFFLAFQQPVQPGTLIAGFGMGIVFFVITVIPQGAGAVEGIMTLVFTSLGIARTKAVVVALAFRGVNFWLPLVLGFLSLHQITSIMDSRPQEEEKGQAGQEAPSS
jgi:uncharacterized protein (TIRG00374 family)